MGAHTPISDSLNNNKEYIEECANTIAAFTNMSVEILMRSNKRETMNRERSKDDVRQSFNEDLRRFFPDNAPSAKDSYRAMQDLLPSPL